jgi:hypothetical protein
VVRAESAGDRPLPSDKGHIRIIWHEPHQGLPLEGAPFSDGAVFKIAEDLQASRQPQLSFPAPRQVEFMIKDAGKYQETAGWVSPARRAGAPA